MSTSRQPSATAEHEGDGPTALPGTVVLWCVDCSADAPFDPVEEFDEGADPVRSLLFVELLCRGCGAASVLGMLAALPPAGSRPVRLSRTA